MKVICSSADILCPTECRCRYEHSPIETTNGYFCNSCKSVCKKHPSHPMKVCVIASTILISTCFLCNKYFSVKSAQGAPGGESHGVCPDCQVGYLERKGRK